MVQVELLLLALRIAGPHIDAAQRQLATGRGEDAAVDGQGLVRIVGWFAQIDVAADGDTALRPPQRRPYAGPAAPGTAHVDGRRGPPGECRDRGSIGVLIQRALLEHLAKLRELLGQLVIHCLLHRQTWVCCCYGYRPPRCR